MVHYDNFCSTINFNWSKSNQWWSSPCTALLTPIHQGQSPNLIFSRCKSKARIKRCCHMTVYDTFVWTSKQVQPRRRQSAERQWSFKAAWLPWWNKLAVVITGAHQAKLNMWQRCPMIAVTMGTVDNKETDINPVDLLVEH